MGQVELLELLPLDAEGLSTLQRPVRTQTGNVSSHWFKMIRYSHEKTFSSVWISSFPDSQPEWHKFHCATREVTWGEPWGGQPRLYWPLTFRRTSCGPRRRVTVPLRLSGTSSTEEISAQPEQLTRLCLREPALHHSWKPATQAHTFTTITSLSNNIKITLLRHSWKVQLLLCEFKGHLETQWPCSDLADCISWQWAGTEDGRGWGGTTSCNSRGWPDLAGDHSGDRWRPAPPPAGSPQLPQTAKTTEELPTLGTTCFLRAHKIINW